MTIEEKVKFQLGDLLMTCTALKEQLDEANAEIARLKAEKTAEQQVIKPNGGRKSEVRVE